LRDKTREWLGTSLEEVEPTFPFCHLMDLPRHFDFVPPPRTRRAGSHTGTEMTQGAGEGAAVWSCAAFFRRVAPDGLDDAVLASVMQ
jgi:hypothetical protein